MNSWKLNGMVGHLARTAINEGLNIEKTQIYKKVKSVDNHGIITTHEGKKYKLVLKEIENEQNTN
jgi:predicted transcriptional regulator